MVVHECNNTSNSRDPLSFDGRKYPDEEVRNECHLSQFEGFLYRTGGL